MEAYATESVNVDARGTLLAGDLAIPAASRGLVVFAHGSGSSRHSTRNRYVARILAQRGFATLLLDLLTEAEEDLDRHTAAYRFDIELLSRRLMGVRDWAAHAPDIAALGVGYFGASTGAAAALVAASDRTQEVQAIVSRGGRPDLAGPAALAGVRAPTLFIVGSNDTDVLRLNREAAACLEAPHEISIVEGAGHLFEEQGALARVSALASAWFRNYLGPSGSASS